MLPVEGPSSNYLTRDAAAQIAADIEEAGGVEVFFVARRGRDGLIHEVESHAYGTKEAVPIRFDLFEPGNVIIHNHPTGNLLPSDADMNVSSHLGQLGVGSYIVNNDATRLRVIIRPHDPREKISLKIDQIEKFLAPNSTLSDALGDYEDRPQQREMACKVAEAFNHDGIVAIEAGTGTGKSLAYLLPSLVYALDNKERVVISTNTINLQEQIIHKDLPVAKQVLGREFKAELVKGRSNYVCKRKAQFARDELNQPLQKLFEDEFSGELREVLAWANDSEAGDLQELTVPPRNEVWERVVSEADNCLRVRCPFYESCFFYNSRRRAARADVLVVNHSLMLSDVAVRRESNNWSTAAVLPPYKHVILDEAHHLEAVATKHLGSQLSPYSIRRLFTRLYRSDARGRKGVLAGVADKLEEYRRKGTINETFPAYKLVCLEIIPSITTSRETIELLLEDFSYAFLDIAGLQPPHRSLEHRVRLTPRLTRHPRWPEEITPRIQGIAAELASLISLNREALKELPDLPDAELNDIMNLAMEWRSITERFESIRRMAAMFLNDDPKICSWVELTADKRQKMQVRLCQAPITVAEELRESLHSKIKSEVLTSATLTVDNDFQFLFERIGVPVSVPRRIVIEPDSATMDDHVINEDFQAENNESATEKKEVVRRARLVEHLKLSAPFDYNSQVFCGVPSDLGDPRAESFERGLASLISKAVGVTEGRAFVLFTSYGQMRRLYDECSPIIQRWGITCLIQGSESRAKLLNRFREEETSVLFATSSFWEGVDVKGRALELLIIAKLPFAVPNDPIQEAQYEFQRIQGRDPFQSLVVPRAIIRFKQGFGRLIRSRTDRGAVLIADERVVRMGYGRRFLSSLPEMDVHHQETDILMDGLRGFLRNNVVRVS